MEKVAIIKQIRIGVCDRGYASLSFHTFVSECEAAMQLLNWVEAKKVIEDAGVADVKDLEGKPCWVNEERGLIVFVKMWRK